LSCPDERRSAPETPSQEPSKQRLDWLSQYYAERLAYDEEHFMDGFLKAAREAQAGAQQPAQGGPAGPGPQPAAPDDSDPAEAEEPSRPRKFIWEPEDIVVTMSDGNVVKPGEPPKPPASTQEPPKAGPEDRPTALPGR
jgi:hypothetical protein